MSNIPLSDIEERVERSIFEAIRQELVDKGLVPDITTYNTATDMLVFEADLKALALTNTFGFVCEVFNVSGYQANGTKKVPRLVIDSQMFLPSELGGDSTRFYIPSNSGFDATIRPPRAADYFFNIHIVANTTKQLRVLQSLLAIALPRRGYIKFYTEPSLTPAGNLFLENLSFIDHPQTEEGIMEKIYRYVIKDVWETPDITLPDPVAAINEIAANIKPEGGTTSTLTVQ